MQNEELRRTQVESEAERARYFELYDLAPVGYLFLSEDGLILEANLAAAAQLGVERATLAKQPITRFILPEDQDIYGRHLRQLFATREPQVCELRLVKKDGGQFWARLEATAAQNAESGAPACRAVVSDITERQRAVEALHESEERYRSLFATSLDAVLLTVPDGRILAANEAACRMFGRSEEEIILAGRSGIMDASDSRLALAMEERARTGKFRGELTFVNKDGTTFPGEVSSAVFTDRHGLPRTSMVIRDVSERRVAEEELRASCEQLRALAASLQAVREEERTHVAREIHDVLAQELTRLKIDLVWLERRLAKPGKAAAPEALAARVSEMSQMVDAAIHSVQRIATGLRPAVLDSLGLCATVEWQARDFQDRTGIPCLASVPKKGLAVDRDTATATFRILQESLTNVLRHAQATRVEILLRQEAGQLILRISDNGRGIPTETLSSPLSIGLAGMRERALLLNGQFKIRSRPGSGTTLEVRLPLSKK